MFVLATHAYASNTVDVAFGNALGISGYDTSNPDHQDLARAAIASLRAQQRLVLTALSHHASVVPELWQSIEHANGILSTMANFGPQLSSFPQYFNPEYTLALGWAANVLPVAVGSAGMSQISEVLSDIVALKTRLAQMRFPPDVQAFMEHLLKDLEHNIIAASFEGAASIDRACRRAHSEVASAAEVLRQSAPELNEEQRGFLSEAATKIDQVGKITGGLSSAIDFAQKLVPLGIAAAKALTG